MHRNSCAMFLAESHSNGDGEDAFASAKDYNAISEAERKPVGGFSHDEHP